MSKPKDTPRELCPEGTHVAVCTGVIDLGTQVVTFKGKEKRQKKLYIEFEPQGVEKESGDRFLTSLRLTNSTSDKSTLFKTLKSWLGLKSIKEFDLAELVNKTALITISHSEDEQYANIDNVSALPKNMKAGKPENDCRSLFLDDTYDADVFEELSDRTKEIIMLSPEFEEVTAEAEKPKKKTPAKTPAKPAKQAAAKPPAKKGKR